MGTGGRSTVFAESRGTLVWAEGERDDTKKRKVESS